MKTFTCNTCQSDVYFENVSCVTCGSPLAFIPSTNSVQALKQLENGRYSTQEGHEYKLCENSLNYGICNEVVDANYSDTLCRSCLYTEVVPNLSQSKNLKYWQKLSIAKRRLLFTLRDLGITPLLKREDRVKGLSFHFLDASQEQGTVFTGHEDGRITIVLAEADDAIREKRRVDLGEGYRTLLGHFRHEVGHYYWDRFIQDKGRIQECRSIFGDESADYAKALEVHYQNGPKQDWQKNFITPYAASHPWEDWAETWAHLLHMLDVLQTADAVGLDRGLQIGANVSIDELIDNWIRLTHILNSLGRSIGTGDMYPFIITPAVEEKMTYIYGVIQAESGN